MLLPLSHPALAVSIAHVRLMWHVELVFMQIDQQFSCFWFSFYFDQLSLQLRVLLLCRLKHSNEGFLQGWFLSVCHHHLHQRRSCWLGAQQVLKFLDQLHHHVLEPQIPTEVCTVPILHFQASAVSTRGHLRFDARGREVGQPAQQHQRVG